MVRTVYARTPRRQFLDLEIDDMRSCSCFFSGMQRHVLSFEAGAVLQDSSKWQAPAYCFIDSNGGSSASANAAASSS